MNIRIKIIQLLLSINESLFFYPRLSNFYKKNKFKTDETIVIFDVGANKGQSIDFFCKMYKNIKIFAFEPNPKLFGKLILKYGNKNNIFLYNVGVSNINGQLELNETVTDETSTFEKLNYNSEYLQMKANVLGVKKEEIINKKYLVDVITLSAFISERRINNIDILKIDTEGHELKCLQGLFNNNEINIKYIQLENHNDDMYLTDESKSEIPNLLNSKGFIKCNIIKHGFGDLDECIYEK